MTRRTLSEWLAWQEQLHPSTIELGLARVVQVWNRLHPEGFAPFVITVAGTNGKGSCVAYLEAILRYAGYRTGSYTSPHLVRYNERIRVDGEQATDEAICDAFERIEQARRTTSLTYFEFGTLAALDIFVRERVDVALLEVGLGGRLDAVNLLDADAVLVTSIGLDHTDWLGDTLDAIAREKAGVLRRGRPAVFAESLVPAGFLQAGFSYTSDRWRWQMGDAELELPLPAMRGDYQVQNAAAVVTLLHRVEERLPAAPAAIAGGLRAAAVDGRFQKVRSSPAVYVDVAHNREAAIALAGNIASLAAGGRVHAIFSIYAGKPVDEIARVLAPHVDSWHIYQMKSSRALDIEALQLALSDARHDASIAIHDSLREALRVLEECDPLDVVVIFGSFEVAGEALEILNA
ncbi:MAG: bifunctional folylpolyglutamate synthase/dihydrofolate synthase [Gammaproteobacteria bacterium]